jgi:hypothetical protein
MLIIAGDVELNPGPGETPVNFKDHCLSIFHGNIRSLRNKVDYISNIIEDYEIQFHIPSDYKHINNNQTK